MQFFSEAYPLRYRIRSVLQLFWLPQHHLLFFEWRYFCPHYFCNLSGGYTRFCGLRDSCLRSACGLTSRFYLLTWNLHRENKILFWNSKLLFKFFNIVWICSPKGLDALICIHDSCDILLTCSQVFNKFELHIISLLELIHNYVGIVISQLCWAIGIK